MAEHPDYMQYHELTKLAPEKVTELYGLYRHCVGCNRYTRRDLVLSVRIWPHMQVVSGPAANFGIPEVFVCPECIENTGWLIPKQMMGLWVALKSKDRAEMPR